LDAWVKESGDLGATPEDPEVVAYWRQWMIDRLEKKNKADQ
jgi:hypothetical protein